MRILITALFFTVVGTLVACGGATTGGDMQSGTPDLGPTGPLPPDPCVASNTCQPGKWVNVSPPGLDLQASLGCGNYGSLAVQIDPMHPEVAYAHFDCRGVWKSADYGLTWTGPINVGSNGTQVADCAGGISVARGSSDATTMFESCIRGNGLGFWKSTNGGVDWTQKNVAPGAGRQDFYPPTVDPYDPNHLVMCGHEMNLQVESTDGGETWTEVHIETAMAGQGGTAAILFVDTGNAATTRRTWLYLSQATGGTIGTWRTTDGGAGWKRVDDNEKAHSYSQLWQPDTGGVVYMAGVYSKLGWGVLRSADYGETWAHVGSAGNENVVIGTKRHIYALDSGSANFEIGDATGMTWASADGPMSSTLGTVQAAVTSDGMYNIILAANWQGGLWRYVEPL